MTDPDSATPAGARFYLPFLAGDGVLLLAATLLQQQAHRPMEAYEVICFTLCVGLGAVVCVLPFVLKQRAEVTLAETGELTDALAQIQNLAQIADKIGLATGQWQTVQEHAVRVSNSSRELVDRMSAETKDFVTFMDKANKTEVNHLRLEVEKLRRGEGEWMQVTVRLLDHVYVLYTAAAHSGQPTLTEQIGNFQNACRDVVRRVGLVPLAVAPGTAYDPEAHQLHDSQTPPAAAGFVAETVAPGYSWQGQLLRLPLVVLQAPVDPATAPVQEPMPETREIPTNPLPSSFASAPAEGPFSGAPDVTPAGSTQERFPL